MQKNLVKIERVVREICPRTDRQTYSHTHRHANYNTSPLLPRAKDKLTDSCIFTTVHSVDMSELGNLNFRKADSLPALLKFKICHCQWNHCYDIN